MRLLRSLTDLNIPFGGHSQINMVYSFLFDALGVWNKGANNPKTSGGLKNPRQESKMFRMLGARDPRDCRGTDLHKESLPPKIPNLPYETPKP